MALPDGAARLLIHTDEGREVVHVLGRKTSVGRTPDNDLQIDAKFISRHHAVILAGPTQTIIEDLNSTNGVQVNGRRVTRQALRGRRRGRDRAAAVPLRGAQEQRQALTAAAPAAKLAAVTNRLMRKPGE